MASDPLLMDILQDPRTRPVGRGEFIRDGVIYTFTQEELNCAVGELHEKLKRYLAGGTK